MLLGETACCQITLYSECQANSIFSHLMGTYDNIDGEVNNQGYAVFRKTDDLLNGQEYIGEYSVSSNVCILLFIIDDYTFFQCK